MINAFFGEDHFSSLFFQAIYLDKYETTDVLVSKYLHSFVSLFSIEFIKVTFMVANSSRDCQGE